MEKGQDNFILYYNQFKDKIYNYFFYRVGFDRLLAEDLTSEVFVKALKSFDNFDKNKKFQPWIYTIAHNHLVNHYAAYKRLEPLESVEPVAVQYSDRSAENNYELDRIIKIIDRMDSNDREVLRLKFIDELSTQEIAAILLKEEGAVRTQISRSLNKLRQMLGGDKL